MADEKQLDFAIAKKSESPEPRFLNLDLSCRARTRCATVWQQQMWRLTFERRCEEKCKAPKTFTLDFSEVAIGEPAEGDRLPPKGRYFICHYEADNKAGEEGCEDVKGSSGVDNSMG